MDATPQGILLDEPTIDDVRAAAGRITPPVVRTPLLESPRLNERLGGRLLVKAESLQLTGSFKFRGAVNRISRLDERARERGIVAYSSGNHAQAVSLAARLFGTKAVIVMPEDAPRVKIAKTRSYGGEVVFYDRYNEDRVAVGAALAAERGLTLVPPYDDTRIIAGQGTLGLEVIEQAAALDASLDAFLICCSGGGLTAGCALAFAADSPNTQVWGVEPEGFDDTLRSLAAGRIVANEPGGRSICDAILADQPGALTFPINRRVLTGVAVVSDAEALAAVRVALDELKVLVEPGGAVALAAALSGKIDCRDRTIGVVLSGGNIDPDVLRQALDADTDTA